MPGAARFFLTLFRYKLSFPFFMIFLPKYMNLLIKFISCHRHRAIYGLVLVDVTLRFWQTDRAFIQSPAKDHALDARIFNTV